MTDTITKQEPTLKIKVLQFWPNVTLGIALGMLLSMLIDQPFDWLRQQRAGEVTDVAFKMAIEAGKWSGRAIACEEARGDSP